LYRLAISGVIVPVITSDPLIVSLTVVPLSIMMRNLAKKNGRAKNRHYGTTTTYAIKTQRPEQPEGFWANVHPFSKT